MTFEEAVEQEYTILVANAQIAYELRKKYKKDIFKSIGIGMMSEKLYGLTKLYVDQKLYFDNYDMLERMERAVKAKVIYGNVPDTEIVNDY
ncbi:hypothetical protein [Metasolibacillus meyeri]|uniref:hypothetical protein n=1 Tax=Metasolibacillus meyeri TaxID=1071052 RepID=UPI000D2F917E|nr:hypothetical protein [Metasolibacillus meyeri]